MPVLARATGKVITEYGKMVKTNRRPTLGEKVTFSIVTLSQLWTSGPLDHLVVTTRPLGKVRITRPRPPTCDDVEDVERAGGEVGQVEAGVEQLVTGTHPEQHLPVASRQK